MHSLFSRCSRSRGSRANRQLSVYTSLLLCLFFTCAVGAQQPGAPLLTLHEGWWLASGCKVTATGEELSSISYRPREDMWQQTLVPSTVLAAQVRNGLFPDPYFGRNLRKLPGVDYPIGKIFARLPMPANSPYACAWWYRTRFVVPRAAQGKSLWLRFNGINYRANIWVNGKLLAAKADVAGAYRTYEFDATKFLVPGRENAIAVQTFAPSENDLAVNWVDWNPAPPDKDMGLIGSVSLWTSGAVTVRSPMVSTHLDRSANDTAEVTILGDLHNAGQSPVSGVVTAMLAGMRVEQPVTLAAGESRTVVFTPAQYPKLKLAHPRLWWPYGMGEPHLEALTMSFRAGGVVSDEATAKVGLREMSSELTEKGARLFRVNGRPVLIRGGGWSQDMLLREDPLKLEQQFALVRDLHLNAIRLEGKLEKEDFYRLADENGVLILAGWCCCDIWEGWEQWTPETYSVAAASLRSQMLRLRSHASLLVWLNGSDNAPIAKVESMYLGIEQDLHWPNPTISAASTQNTSVSGPNGVKMTGPYDYVAPSYWLTDPGTHGGAWGFNTETGPGPAIPVESSLRRFLPADALWPRGEDWYFHAGSGDFRDTAVFDIAMQHTYGDAKDLAQYERYAQAMAFDGERAMFEAYARNKYSSTGVVQWMLNNAWPSLIWHLYDYYLSAGGGYYGTKAACEPLHVQYSYDDHSVVVVNSTYVQKPGLRLESTVYDLQLKPVYQHSAALAAGPDSTNRVFDIPAETLSSGAPMHFVRLLLRGPEGKIVSENTYWLSSQPAKFDWSKNDYRYTPMLQYPDLTALNNLPKAHLAADIVRHDADGAVTLRLRNDSQALAFQVTLDALDQRGQPVLPALWSTNYLEVFPGESRMVTVRPAVRGGVPVARVAIHGWNIAEQHLAVAEAQAQ